MAIDHVSLVPEPLKAATDLCQNPISDLLAWSTLRKSPPQTNSDSVHRFNTHISDLLTKIDSGILTVNMHIVI